MEDFQINGSNQVAVTSTPFNPTSAVHVSTEDSSEIDLVHNGSTTDIFNKRIFVSADDARVGTEKYG